MLIIFICTYYYYLLLFLLYLREHCKSDGKFNSFDQVQPVISLMRSIISHIQINYYKPNFNPEYDVDVEKVYSYMSVEEEYFRTGQYFPNHPIVRKVKKRYAADNDRKKKSACTCTKVAYNLGK